MKMLNLLDYSAILKHNEVCNQTRRENSRSELFSVKAAVRHLDVERPNAK